MSSTTLLSEPMELSNKVKIKNRIFKSAMSEGLSTKNHLPNDQLLRLYKAWAEGGAGLVVTGNVMVDRRALGEPRNVVLEDDNNLSLFKKWANAGTKNNTQLWMQINHPGKQVFKGVVKEAVAPSAVPFESKLQRFFPLCRALTVLEIREIINRFAQTALLAKRAGFTGVQIHAAHGYLISQFLSPIHNKRMDEWGGPIENRFRFLSEIYLTMREKVGDDFPIGVKINSSDFSKAGFSEEESQFVIEKLDNLGVNLIEISGGTYEKPEMTGKNVKASTMKREAYFMDYAEKLKKKSNVPLVLTGGFRTLEGMEHALHENATDMIGLARPMAIYPNFPNLLMENDVPTLGISPVKTGLSFIDDRAMLELTWYSQQLERIAKGKATKPSFSPLLSLFLTLAKNGKEVFQQRRA
ncbi:NADH:flavin oxidoreductase/NADH oxidase family protein [Salipaludibacillus daqingensis]|uniref:NADH:flavin oxidoreductase/NADH oxidase family protein n=1 Tax=Salipaludibacillus daqingensis TaxID=3041001 RepID=UPI0024770FA4|nr:NADH:flavin oxidoreductase/NADH oxidase family protein [Salipaludibacillus daqingensis]